MSSSTPASDHLDRFWLPPPPSTLSSLPAIRSQLAQFPSPGLSVSRVAQLDASLLDNELEGILGGPVWKAMEGIRKPGRRSWEPEMMALLRMAVLKMSLYDRGATYGSGLQNLKYRNEWEHAGEGKAALQSTAMDSTLLPAQKAAYMALLILPTYLHSRLRDRMLVHSWAEEDLPRSWLSLLDFRRWRRRGEDEGRWIGEWKRVGWEVMQVGEKVGAMAGLVNFLVFLYDGRYRTLVDRILGMRLVYAQRSITPNVSFEFLNRQLVWEAFTEFLLFLMPLINVHRLRLRLSRLLSTKSTRSTSLALIIAALPTPLARSLGLSPSSSSSITTKTAANPEEEKSSEKKKSGTTERPQGAYHFLPPTTCPICYAAAHAPPTSLPGDPTTTSSSLVATAGELDTSVKLAYVTDCGWQCRYCYYCVVGKLVEVEEEQGGGEEGWGCLRCGGGVRGVRREVVVLSAGEGEGDAVEKRDDEASGEGSEGEEGAESGSSHGSEHERWRE